MTESRIRELLEDAAQPVDSRDLADVAWQTARHERSRLRIGLAAAVVLVAAGGTAIGVTAGQRDGSAPAASQSAPTSVRTLESGVAVQTAPLSAGEAKLPPADGGLPAKIALNANASLINNTSVDRVVAAFVASDGGASTQPRPVQLIAADGTQYRLDISRLGPSPDAASGASPFTAGSLSTNGAQLAFAQIGAVEIYTLRTHSWQHFPVPGVSAQTIASLSWRDWGIRLGPNRALDLETGDLETIGATFPGEPSPPAGVRIVESVGPPFSVTTGNVQGGYLTSPTTADDSRPFAIVLSGTSPAVLLIPRGNDHQRIERCCAVVGTQGSVRVVYESKSVSGTAGQTSRLIAWNFLTDELRLLSTVTADHRSFTGSYSSDFYNG